MIPLIQNLKKCPNPFNLTSVAGLEDSHPFPVFEEYLQESKLKLEECFQKYENKNLIPPILFLTGKTGSGKTFLLRYLAQKARTDNTDRVDQENYYLRFFLPTSPREILQTATNITEETTASILWTQLIKSFSKKSVFPFQSGKQEYSLFDLYSYRLSKELLKGRKNKNIEKKLPWGWFREFKEEQYFLSFQRFLDSLKKREAKKIWKVLHQCIQDIVNEEDSPFFSWILSQSFGMEVPNPIEKDSSIEKLRKFIRFTQDKKISVIFVFDQFEDLQLISKDLNQEIEKFLLALFELERSIQNKENLPLFLLSTFYHDSELPKHMLERLPIVAPGNKSAIDLPITRLKEDFKVAEKLAKCYIEKHLERYKKELGSLSAEELFQNLNLGHKLKENHSEITAGQPEITPRQWLRKCQETWDDVLENFSTNLFNKKEAPIPVVQPPPVKVTVPSPVPSEKSEKVSTFTINALKDSLFNQSLFYQSVSLFIKNELEKNPNEESRKKFLSVIYHFFKLLNENKLLEMNKNYTPSSNFIPFSKNGKNVALNISLKSNRGGGFGHDLEDFHKDTQNKNYDYLYMLRPLRPQSREFENKDILSKGIPIKIKIVDSFDWCLLFYVIYFFGDRDFLANSNIQLEELSQSPLDILSLLKQWNLFNELFIAG
ncbi:MAG: hypothetical protein AABZ60_01425 [Planctomycetota bacterium]